jgi:hypothetical protein
MGDDAPLRRALENDTYCGRRAARMGQVIRSLSGFGGGRACWVVSSGPRAIERPTPLSKLLIKTPWSLIWIKYLVITRLIVYSATLGRVQFQYLVYEMQWESTVVIHNIVQTSVFESIFHSLVKPKFREYIHLGIGLVVRYPIQLTISA